MTWFRIDDSFSDNAKVVAAGNEAAGLYVRCGAYSSRHLTDGFVPEHVALLYGSPELVSILLATKLWCRRKGGYAMRDFLTYNPSKKEVVDKRKVRAEAGRLGGLASGKSRSKPEANASRLVEAKRTPDPTPKNGSVSSGTERSRAARAGNPDLSQSTFGAAARQPPPYADAVRQALNPKDTR